MSFFEHNVNFEHNAQIKCKKQTTVSKFEHNTTLRIQRHGVVFEYNAL